jgi:hypothetical protein
VRDGIGKGFHSLLCGENIAKEDFLDVFGLDLGDSLNGSCRQAMLVQAFSEVWFYGLMAVCDEPLIAVEPSWIALRLERDLDAQLSVPIVPLASTRGKPEEGSVPHLP